MWKWCVKKRTRANYKTLTMDLLKIKRHFFAKINVEGVGLPLANKNRYGNTVVKWTLLQVCCFCANFYLALYYYVYYSISLTHQWRPGEDSPGSSQIFSCSLHTPDGRNRSRTTDQADSDTWTSSYPTVDGNSLCSAPRASREKKKLWQHNARGS